MKSDIHADNPRSSADHNGQWDAQIAKLIVPAALHPWREPGYRAMRVAVVGFMLGAIAGCTSLLVNIIGSVLWPTISGVDHHPLRLIQVFLTFPLGERALALNNGGLLALGCLLYLGTGMLYGMLFELALSYYLPRAGLTARLIVCSLLAILIWGVNFYGILIWLQPLLFGGSWIIDLVPWWVAAATHLIFGWTMALIYPLGARP